MKAEEAEAGGKPRSENPDDSRDSDLDIGENDESPCTSPKGDRFESGENSDDDIDVDAASDTDDDYLHHQQTLMAAHLRLYQSAAEAAVQQQEPGLKITAAAHSPRMHTDHSVSQAYLRNSPTQPDMSWSKQSSIV